MFDWHGIGIAAWQVAWKNDRVSNQQDERCVTDEQQVG